jgi:ribonuclease Z
LPGLISTLSLLGRTADLNIYAHKEIDFLLNPLLTYLGSHLSFKINLFPLNPHSEEKLFENKMMRVTSFPLKHRIDTNGFLFEQKQSPRHIKREMIDFYHVPVKQINEIKNGADYLCSDGNLILNEHLTTPGKPSRKYAYCSDTAYSPEIITYIKNVDLLYHEATFAESERNRAEETFHSTAQQAAEIALAAGVKKLMIGHFSSRYNETESLLKEAMAVFPNTELAVEGKIVSL